MKKILVPCDFSDTSENALNYAVEAAAATGGELILANITNFPVVAPEIGLSAYTYQDAEKDSLEALDKMRERLINERHFTGKITSFTEMGEFSDAIDTYVKDNAVDLIIMGISGHGNKFMKTVIGSSAINVGKRVETPVLVIPPDTVFRRPSMIVYACHHEEQIAIERGFLKVKAVAELFKSEVRLLHVIESKDEQRFQADSDLYYEHTNPEHDIKSFIIHEKNAADGILRFMNEHHADIVAIQPKKHRFLENLFKQSVTNEVVFNSTVPVMLVH